MNYADRGGPERKGSFVVGVIFLMLISCAGAIAMSLSGLSSGARNVEGTIQSGRTAMALAESAIAEVLAQFTRTLAARTGGQDVRARLLAAARGGVVAGPDVLGTDEFTFEPVRTRGLTSTIFAQGFTVGAVTVRPAEYRLVRNFGTLRITGTVLARDAVWTVVSYHHFVLKCDGTTMRVDPVPFQVLPSHRRRS